MNSYCPDPTVLQSPSRASRFARIGSLNRSFSPELSLVVACCRWPRSPEQREEVRLAARHVSDWACFDAIVRRNRISLLVHDALTTAQVTMPDSLHRELSGRARAAARRSLDLARDSLHLQRAFEAQGIPVMIVKGVPLAMLAYGELGVKESIDIDLLVSPERAVDARRLLIELGYTTSLDRLDESQFERLLKVGTEAGFYDPRRSLKVDLHWQLIESSRLLTGVDASGPSQNIAVPGGTLRTLADEALFPYLCVHGAIHNWSRLKWLADLGAFIGSRTEAEVERLVRSAAAYSVDRPVSVALLLCRRLFGVPANEDRLQALEKDLVVRALAENAVAGLAYRKGAVEQSPYTAAWLRGLAAQFFLVPGARYTLEQLKRTWTSTVDRTHIALPRHWTFLYHLLRIPLWVGRVTRRLLKLPT